MAAAPALTLLKHPSRRAETDGLVPGGMFAPDQPLDWRVGVWRYADEAYWWLRLREWVRRQWYSHGLRMPRTSTPERRMLPDYRGTYGSYAEAAGWCAGRKNWFAEAIPYGQTPLGDELFPNPTLICPAEEPDRHAAFLAAYTTILEDHLCPQLMARVRVLASALMEQDRVLNEALQFANADINRQHDT